MLCLFFLYAGTIVFAEKTQWLSIGYERSGYSYTSTALSPGALAFGSNGLNIQGYTF